MHRESRTASSAKVRSGCFFQCTVRPRHLVYSAWVLEDCRYLVALVPGFLRSVAFQCRLRPPSLPPPPSPGVLTFPLSLHRVHYCLSKGSKPKPTPPPPGVGGAKAAGGPPKPPPPPGIGGKGGKGSKGGPPKPPGAKMAPPPPAFGGKGSKGGKVGLVP